MLDENIHFCSLILYRSFFKSTDSYKYSTNWETTPWAIFLCGHVAA